MLQVDFHILNQRATPAFYADALANRPAAGFAGRVFIDTDSPSTGIYRDTGTAWVQVAQTASTDADTLQIVTDRGNTTTQDVAIGTNSTPSAPLDVHGAGVIAILQGTGTNDSFLQYNKSGSGKFKVGNVHNAGNDYYTIYNLQENADAILVNISTNNVAIGGGIVAPSYRLDVQGSFRTTGASYLATSGGNVGIGTTSPAYTLDVNGTARISGTELRLDNGTTGTLNIYSNTPSIQFFSSDPTGYRFYRSGTGMFWNSAGSITTQISGNDAYTLNATNGHIWRTALSGGAALARLTTGGNMIIGSTTDAGYKLDVNGTARTSHFIFNATAGNNPQITNTYNSFVINAASGNLQLMTTSTGYIYVGNSTSGGDIRLVTAGNSERLQLLSSGRIQTRDTQPLTFGVNQTEYARITSDGILAVGTTSPNASALLDVSSTTKGFLPPRMTTAQKTAIANTAGLVVFDTTLAKLCVNSGAGWETITSV